eukprot:jgi/Mesen1/3178/ME000184S02259
MGASRLVAQISRSILPPPVRRQVRQRYFTSHAGAFRQPALRAYGSTHARHLASSASSADKPIPARESVWAQSCPEPGLQPPPAAEAQGALACAVPVHISEPEPEPGSGPEPEPGPDPEDWLMPVDGQPSVVALAHLQRENERAAEVLEATRELQEELVEEMSCRMPPTEATPPEAWGPWRQRQVSAPERTGSTPASSGTSSTSTSGVWGSGGGGGWGRVKRALGLASAGIGRKKEEEEEEVQGEEVLLDQNELAEQFAQRVTTMAAERHMAGPLRPALSGSESTYELSSLGVNFGASGQRNGQGGGEG